MESIHINDAGKEEQEYIVQQLIKFNHTKLLFQEETPFLHINKCIKNDNEIIGGVLAEIYWNVLHINILWVKESYRNKGYATALLNDVENIAKEMNCKTAHLDTFDFQAKSLYEKRGYTVFGVLEDCPENHKRYYMSKKL